MAKSSAKAPEQFLNGNAKNVSLSFQDLILTLHRYWGEQGCVILQPYDMEMGRGRSIPATVLRRLWARSVEGGLCPAVPPADRRALWRKPQPAGPLLPVSGDAEAEPAELQELYLGSLDAIGIDPLKHDIRFVEDDWESPTLGAWGLGWEVWCDGMEVTQFTYFQQVAGSTASRCRRADLRARAAGDVYPGRRQCVRPAVQHHGVTYGDVFLENEREMSKWHFEVADTDALFDLFRRPRGEREQPERRSADRGL
jgi:glycyl-tRNA synthetase alpha chain